MTHRGFLPPYIDVGRTLLGGSWVIRTLSSMLYPFHMQFLRPPATNALEDSLLARNHLFKLDVLTPISIPRTRRNNLDCNEVALSAPTERGMRVTFADEATPHEWDEHLVASMDAASGGRKLNVQEAEGSSESTLSTPQVPTRKVDVLDAPYHAPYTLNVANYEFISKRSFQRKYN